MTLPLSESEYQEALKLAQTMERTAGAVTEIAEAPIKWAFQLSRALIQAHSERRTPGTVEVCKKCRRNVIDGPSCLHKSVSGGFTITDNGCPLRRGNAP